MSTRNWALGLTFGVAALSATSTASAGMLEDFNDTLAAEGANFRVYYVEGLTTDGTNLTVYAKNVGNKQMPSHWVPFDPNRGGYGDISWMIDQVDASQDLSLVDSNAAIGRAMDTWDEVDCSTIPLTQLPDLGLDWGVIQNWYWTGGIGGWWADITHAGWLPGEFFDLWGPNGSTYILAVTFTLIWVEDGVPTDIDRNGKADTALREIYYNDAFAWAIDDHYDVETIALHEMGHGLSQAHFGTIFRDPVGGLHFAPRAVMNAAYSGVQHDLTGTDIAGHCSIWASWPLN